jgi:hypothetical protein
MSTFPIRKLLVDIALRDVGQIETSRNQGPAMKRYWPATSYPDGHRNREPYCAAAVCYWVREWLRLPEVAKAFGKTTTQLEAWRCKSPRAFGWQDWAAKKNITVFDDNQAHTLHTGDIMVFDMSHIGIVADDKRSEVYTIEANTGPSGGRDGDGVWRKRRHRSLARCFIRLLA